MKRSFKIRLEGKPRYHHCNWLVCREDLPYEALYAAKVGMTYFFIELNDCGRDADARWEFQVSSVELDQVSEESVSGAFRSYGVGPEEIDLTTEQGLLQLAEMLHGYGAKAYLWGGSAGDPKSWTQDENSLAFRSLRKQAREAAEELIRDSGKYEQQMVRAVNKIGQTAREYMQGGESFWDAIRRCQNDPKDDKQRLVGKMYAACEQTLGAGPIPADIQGK